MVVRFHFFTFNFLKHSDVHTEVLPWEKNSCKLNDVQRFCMLRPNDAKSPDVSIIQVITVDVQI